MDSSKNKSSDYDFEYAPEEYDSLYEEGNNVIDITLRYYPDMAKGGWCFATNVKRLRNLKPLSILDITKIENDSLESFKHMKPSQVHLNFSGKAYWMDGNEDPSMLPTFVKVEDSDYLDQLGWEDPNKTYTRFDFIDWEE